MRIVRYRGVCPHCQHTWTEVVVCVCGHRVTNHRIDLKRVVCELADCGCKAYREAPGQEDINPRGNAA